MKGSMIDDFIKYAKEQQGYMDVDGKRMLACYTSKGSYKNPNPSFTENNPVSREKRS